MFWQDTDVEDMIEGLGGCCGNQWTDQRMVLSVRENRDLLCRPMDELVPICLGIILGVPIWRYTAGRERALLSVLAVAMSGVTATIVSGEFAQGYLYLLIDLGEAVCGLAAGFAIAQRLGQRRHGAGVLTSARP